MATSAQKKAPKAAPKLADIIADAAAKQEAAKAAEAEAKAAIDTALAERRAERDAVLQEVSDAFAKAREVEAEGREKLTALEAKVEEEFGIPAALFNSDLAPKVEKKASKAGNGSSRAKTADIGPIGPVVVTAPYRRGNGEKDVHVQYMLREADAQLGPELLAARVDGPTVQEEVAYSHSSYVSSGGFTHNRPSAAITQPGWHETDDVLYALASVAGKDLGIKPTSDLSAIKVNGQPLAQGYTSTTEAEPIEETV